MPCPYCTGWNTHYIQTFYGGIETNDDGWQYDAYECYTCSRDFVRDIPPEGVSGDDAEDDNYYFDAMFWDYWNKNYWRLRLRATYNGLRYRVRRLIDRVLGRPDDIDDIPF